MSTTSKEAWRKKIAAPAATGDCYQAAGRYMMDHGIVGGEDIRLVHGEVRGQGPIEGIRFGHAWIEQGDTVIDVANGKVSQLPKALYYAFGGIYPDLPPFKPNIHVYTPEEAREKILEYKHWGPWDLKTSSGL